MKRAFSILILLSVWACDSPEPLVENELHGYAQGSTYQIKFLTTEMVNWTTAVDSIFKVIDSSMSTYVESSLISSINRGDTVEVDRLFMDVLNRSLEISAETNGLFDPTVGPLVELWGFGKDRIIDIDSSKVDSAKALVNYRLVHIDGNRVNLPIASKIDFNSIAQGYTVDVISEWLESKGVKDYMVEVGGEVRARGVNAAQRIWVIGVDKPSEEIDEEDRFQMIIELKDKSLATSGNYRKFWIDSETGIKYAHTIDPISGYPAKNQLLSVSILAEKCMDADAYATACMVMGLSRAQEFINSKTGLEAYFISTDENGDWKVSSTKGFDAAVLKGK